MDDNFEIDFGYFKMDNEDVLDNFDILEDVNLEQLFAEMTDEVTITSMDEEFTDQVTEMGNPVVKENNGRFEITTEEKLKELEQQRHSKSTLRNTKWGLKMFNDWSFQTRNMQVNWETILPTELAELLRCFYAETRPQVSNIKGSKVSTNSEDYHRNTMKNLRAALNRHLRLLGRPLDIVKDREFRRANDLLNGKLKAAVREGKSKPTKHKPVIDNGDLMKIRAYLDHESPTCTLYKCWFDLSFHFVSRGLEFHSQLKPDSFEFCVDDEGREYAAINHETVQKTTQGGIHDPQNNTPDKRMYASGTSRCPVSNLKLLISKLPPLAEKLFCIPKSNATINDPVWYSGKAMSERQLGQIIRQVSKECSLSRVYTPHCVRATAIQALADANVELRHIMYLSGHRNEASIRSYNRSISTDKKHELSTVLQSLTDNTTDKHPAVGSNVQISATVSRNPDDFVPNGNSTNLGTETVSRHPNFGRVNSVQNTLSTAENNSFFSQEFNLSQIAGSSGGFLPRSLFNNCSINFTINTHK